MRPASWILEAHPKFLSTGNMTCFIRGDDFGPPVATPCAGTGQDGEFATGAALTYVDNGDRSITDVNTDLQWEKKSFDGDALHDRNNVYPWSGKCTGDSMTWCNRDGDCNPNPGGTCSALSISSTIFQWIDKVNSSALGGHNDWRIPNLRELETLKDLGYADPAIAPAFNSRCVSGCSLFSCSCTSSNTYWTSDTFFPAGQPGNGSFYNAYAVDFMNGLSSELFKQDLSCVRAVRGGS